MPLEGNSIFLYQVRNKTTKVEQWDLAKSVGEYSLRTSVGVATTKITQKIFTLSWVHNLRLQLLDSVCYLCYNVPVYWKTHMSKVEKNLSAI